MNMEASGGAHERSCVMLYLPKDIGRKIYEWGEKHVPDEWLTGDGREDLGKQHVTLLYGIKSKDMAEVEPYFPEGPVEAQLGKIGRFDTSPEFDVIKIEVHSDELAEFHYAMAERVDNDDSHPEYKAHATIAYVAKGKGKQFDGDRTFDGLDLKLDDLVWSPAGEGEDRKKHVRLGKEKASTSWLWTPNFLRI